jgi:hypothetical protein
LAEPRNDPRLKGLQKAAQNLQSCSLLRRVMALLARSSKQIQWLILPLYERRAPHYIYARIEYKDQPAQPVF